MPRPLPRLPGQREVTTAELDRYVAESGVERGRAGVDRDLEPRERRSRASIGRDSLNASLSVGDVLETPDGIARVVGPARGRQLVECVWHDPDSDAPIVGPQWLSQVRRVGP